jgi:hypothetical protein
MGTTSRLPPAPSPTGYAPSVGASYMGTTSHTPMPSLSGYTSMASAYSMGTTSSLTPALSFPQSTPSASASMGTTSRLTPTLALPQSTPSASASMGTTSRLASALSITESTPSANAYIATTLRSTPAPYSAQSTPSMSVSQEMTTRFTPAPSFTRSASSVNKRYSNTSATSQHLRLLQGYGVMEDSPDIAAAIQETTTRLPDTRLTNIYATRADVLEDIAELYPLLSPSRPEIAAFMQLLDNQPRTNNIFLFSSASLKTGCLRLRRWTPGSERS